MKLKVFIVAEHNRFEKRYDFCAWPCPPSEGKKTLVEEREIDFDAPPDSVLTAGTIAAYKTEQQRIRAEMQSKVNMLQQAIDDLLAIEDKRAA